MRHALILRTLRLPLIAAVCICCFIVATTAFTRLSVKADSSSAEFESSQDSVTDGSSVTPKALGGSIDTFVGDERWFVAHARQNGTNSDDRIWDYDSLVEQVEDYLRDKVDQLSQAAEILTSSDAATNDASEANASATAGTGSADELEGTVDAAIELINPAENGLRVLFLVGEEVKVLEPGESIGLPVSETTVHFDRGDGQDTESRAVGRGRYEFRLAPAGWTLQPKAQ